MAKPPTFIDLARSSRPGPKRGTSWSRGGGGEMNFPTRTPTSTPPGTPTPTPSNTPTISVTPSVTPTITVTPSVTPTQTVTPSNTPPPTPSNTPTKTPTPTPSVTPSNTPPVTPSNTPTKTPTPTVTPTTSAAPTPTPSNTPTTTPTPTVTNTATPTNTPTPTPTPTLTPTATVPAPFSIEYEFNGTWTDAQSGAVVDAIERWEEIITTSHATSGVHPDFKPGFMGGEPNPLSGQPITNLFITVSSQWQGPSGPLGSALATAFRENSASPEYRLPLYGGFKFNEYFLPSMLATTLPNSGLYVGGGTSSSSNKSQLYHVAVHEIGHILGVASNFWKVPGTGGETRDWLIHEEGDPGVDGFYYNTVNGFVNGMPTLTSHAVTAYNEIFGTSLSAIPIEEDGGGGTQGSHHEEGHQNSINSRDNRCLYGNVAPAMRDELMSGVFNNILYMPISKVTVGMLDDLGYKVDYNMADVYRPLEWEVAYNTPSNLLLIRPAEQFGNFFWSHAGRNYTLRRGLTYTFYNFHGSYTMWMTSVSGVTGNPPPNIYTDGMDSPSAAPAGGTMTITVSAEGPDYLYIQTGEETLSGTMVMLVTGCP